MASAFWIVPTLTPWLAASSSSEGSRSPSRNAPDSILRTIASVTRASFVTMGEPAGYSVRSNRLMAVSRTSRISLETRVPDATSTA